MKTFSFIVLTTVFIFSLSGLVSAASWWDSSYKLSRQIHISNLSTNVANQVVFLQLNSSFDYANTVNNLSDIRFTNMENTTEYKYWRDFVNTSSGYSWIAIQIPNSTNATNGGTMQLYMYYNNSAVSTSENSSIFNFYESCDSTSEWVNSTHASVGAITTNGYFLQDPRGVNSGCNMSDIDTSNFNTTYTLYSDSSTEIGLSLWMRTGWTGVDAGTFGLGTKDTFYVGIQSSQGGGNGMKMLFNETLYFRSSSDLTDGKFLMETIFMNATNDQLTGISNISTDSVAGRVNYGIYQPFGASYHPFTRFTFSPQQTAQVGSLYVDEIKTFPTTYSIPVITFEPAQGYGSPASINLMNITVLNENDASAINGFNYTLTNLVNVTITGNISDSNNLSVSNNSLIAGTYKVTISADSYTTRNYYIYVNGQTTVTLTAYLLPTSDQTTVTFTARDIFNDPIENVLIKIERYIGTEWTTIDELNTSSYGSAVSYLKSSVPYQANASISGYEDQLKTFFTTDSPVPFTFGTEYLPDYFSWLNGQIKATCTETTTPRNVECTMTDNAGIVTSGHLIGSELFNITTIRLCDVTSLSSPFILSCAWPSDNYTFVYYYYAVTNEGEFLVGSGTMDFYSPPVDYGVMGVFITFILFITMSFLFIKKPEVGIIFGLLSIIITFRIGFLNIGSSALFSLAFVAFIIIYMLVREP